MNKKLLNKPALAMLQPPPLPGTYTYTGKTIDEIVKDCLSEAKMILENNFDGIILQNMNDMPIKQHSNFQTVAYMTRIAQEIKKKTDYLSIVGFWRRHPDSNWGWSFCRALPYHLAMSPYG